MNLSQLAGRYSRLQQELAAAYLAQPWHGARIDRLVSDLSATEREIAAAQARDEHTDPQPTERLQ